MSTNIYYGIGHVSCLLTLIIVTITSIKYLFIRKKADIYLEKWIFIFGLFCCLYSTIFIIYADFIIKVLLDDWLTLIIFLGFHWVLGWFLLFISSNYYGKIKEDSFIIHSIWFSKFEIKNEYIHKNTSFNVFTGDSYLFDEYLIFFYNDRYYIMAIEYYFIDIKSILKYTKYHTKLFGRINNKKDFINFRKKNKCKSLTLMFVNLNRKNVNKNF